VGAATCVLGPTRSSDQTRVAAGVAGSSALTLAGLLPTRQRAAYRVDRRTCDDHGGDCSYVGSYRHWSSGRIRLLGSTGDDPPSQRADPCWECALSLGMSCRAC